MKKLVIISLVIVLLLVGCSQDASQQEELDQAAVLKNIKEHRNDVENYAIELNLTFDQKAKVEEMKPFDGKQTVNIVGEIKYKEDRTLDSLYTDMKVEANSANQHVESYYANGQGYINQEEIGWSKFDQEMLLDSTYYPAIDSFLAIEDNVQMTKEDNQYVFTYTGNSFEVFDKVKSVFAMALKDLSEDQIELSFVYRFNMDSFALEEIEHHATYDHDQISGSVLANGKFTGINETEVRVPENLPEE